MSKIVFCFQCVIKGIVWKNEFYCKNAEILFVDAYLQGVKKIRENIGMDINDLVHKLQIARRLFCLKTCFTRLYCSVLLLTLNS